MEGEGEREGRKSVALAMLAMSEEMDRSRRSTAGTWCYSCVQVGFSPVWGNGGSPSSGVVIR